MTFDSMHFNSLLDQIETKLGYLKGNELAWEYLVDSRDQLDREAPGGGYRPVRYWLDDCVFPVPGHPVDPQRWFEFTFWVHVDVFADPSRGGQAAAANAQYMRDVASNAMTAWSNGASWAAGIADYCRSVADAFTRPSVDDIVSGIQILHNQVTSQFAVDVLDDWAGLGGIESDWDSEGGRHFQTFYANYDGQIAQMAYASVQVAQVFAAAAHVIHGTQQGAIAFLESIVQILDQQLAAWAPIGPPPEEPPENPPWVADVTKIVTEGWDVLGHIPVVSVVTDQVDEVLTAGQDVVEFASAIADATGADLPTITRVLSGADSEDIHTLLTDTLYDDYQQKFKAAMDSLQSGTSIDPSHPTYAPPISTSTTMDTMPPGGWFPASQMPDPSSMI